MKRMKKIQFGWVALVICTVFVLGALAADEAVKFKEVRGKEGFWRVAQTEDGVWWFLSPDGKTEFLNTVTNVHPVQKGMAKEGPHYVSRDWNGGPSREGGDIDKWAAKTIKRIHKAGFKGLGAWCDRTFHKYNVAMSRDLNVWSSLNKSKLFYDSDWASAAEEVIKSQVAELRDNKNLVGYFTDNELGWKDGFGGPRYYFNGLQRDNPNRRELMKIIQSTWESVEAFNKDWQANLKSWDELEGWNKLPEQPASANVKLASAWVYHLAKDYFTLTSELVRKYDPNHLVMGIRYKGGAPVELFKASRGLTDVQSINIYSADAQLDREMFDAMYNEAQQPIVISEYAFHSLGGRSGNKNLSGFIWGHVTDQKAKADGYRLFTTRMARVPYIIGADWFQWNDEPPSGREDGEDVNFGVVDAKDKPYKNLVKAIKATKPLLNKLHGKSAADEGKDIWKPSAAEKPVFDVPYTKGTVRRIVIDGYFGEWPGDSPLGALEYVKKVGIERSDELVSPKVFLCWSEEGIYVGVKVYDKEIQAYPIDQMPPEHIWRARSFDCVEVWFSTRPVGPEQKWYDRYCHEFLFLPDLKKTTGGTVVQWDQPGDAIEDYIIDGNDIKYMARAWKGGYALEMFVPAKLLEGFDPVNAPEMLGNVFVRNWQDAIDYYWAATEFGGPNSWGILNLTGGKAK
jgi:hypothetical protein